MTKTEKLKQIKLLGESASQKNIFSIFKDKCEIVGGGGGVIFAFMAQVMPEKVL
jgi:hypothetical protein